MSINAQGSELYTIDPDTDELIKIACVTDIDGIDTTNDQIETTCLEDLARTYDAGLATPGTATFGIQVDPREETHVRLHQLKVAGTTLKWALGWADGTGTDPTITTDSNGDPQFDLQDSRSWIAFEGYMNSYPFSFQQNAKVTSSIGIQISGEPLLVPAVPQSS